MPFQVPVGPFGVPVRHFQGSVGIHTKAWDGSVSLAPFHFQAKVTFVCERNVCFGFKQVSSLSLSCQEHSCTRLILNLNTLPHQRKPQ